MRSFILLAFLAAGNGFAASEFCAVTVHVVDELGRNASTTARLLDGEGRTVETSKVVDGEVAFCDFGFGKHSIQIGQGCGSVTLNEIRFVYGLPKRFQAVWNGCPTGIDGGVYPPGCLLYLRASSEEGVKLSGAVASSSAGPWEFHADSYGRLFIGLRSGTGGSFRVTSPGYQPEEVQAACQGMETIQREVRLKRR